MAMPRLSTDLPGERAPNVCQSCGAREKLSRWREHDERDRPENVFVVLCARCEKKLVEPHKRLYAQIQPNEPIPGTLDLCVPCAFRDGLRCTHPDLKANGGAGLFIKIEKPIVAHLCRSPRRLSGYMRIWTKPAETCRGRKETITTTENQ
jgi:hypothetical protein